MIKTLSERHQELFVVNRSLKRGTYLSLQTGSIEGNIEEEISKWGLCAVGTLGRHKRLPVVLHWKYIFTDSLIAGHDTKYWWEMT